MTHFKYSFYRILYEKKENQFETIFKEIKKQIEIYYKQYLLTLKSYKKQWNDEKTILNTTFEKQKEEAEKVYKNTFENNNEEDNFSHQYAMNVSGLDFICEQHSSNLIEIDNEYQNFLDLYSKSILIALYSLNESKLNEIINLASEIFNKKIKPSHFNARDYLNSSFQYLELVIEIELIKIKKYISKLKDLQFLRNSIIHSESKFSDINLAKKIIDKQKDTLKLNEKGQLKIIGSKFSKDIFNLLFEFYEELFWLIDSKQEFAILQNGLIHWIGQIDRKITINNFKITYISQNEKQVYFKVIPDNSAIQEFECKINLKKSNSKSFELINQTENEILKGFLEYEKKLNGIYLTEVFTPMFFNESINIKLLVY